MSVTDNQDVLETLLDYLKRVRGFDFTGYKRPGLERRIRKRMSEVGINEFEAYIDYLEVHPDEFTTLFNTILINVTDFFRDPEIWDYLRDDIVPRLIHPRPPGGRIRVWSAGCAAGKEAYTLTMLLVELLGEEQFNSRVKIYATDVDEEALAEARQGHYTAKEVESVPQDYLAKYFDLSNGRYAFRKDLRRAIIFGRHDLMQDAPISRVDLLVCRNTMMYFNHETQSRILDRLHFALNDGGFLFLGKAEMLLTQAHLFSPIDLKRRIFKKVVRPHMRDRLLLMAQGNSQIFNTPTHATWIRDLSLDTTPFPQLSVDTNGLVVLINSRARLLFNLSEGDVGRPLQDLEVSYRPIEIRGALAEAYVEQRPVYLKDVPLQTGSGESLWFEIQIVPLIRNGAELLGASIIFVETTGAKRLQRNLEQSNQALETAYEEMQATNEELETTNEELQSTIEELETTNEELQSTNEEMETMNEELQSTNEELETMNEELQRRSEELNQVNSFLEAILGSLKGGVVVVDPDLQIQVWNYKTEMLWGLRTEEVEGHHLLNLDIGLPVDQLRQPLWACLQSESEGEILMLPATNRRGKNILCRVTCIPLINRRSEVQGVILIMEETEP